MDYKPTTFKVLRLSFHIMIPKVRPGTVFSILGPYHLDPGSTLGVTMLDVRSILATITIHLISVVHAWLLGLT